MSKKFWTAFIVIFVVWIILDYLVHGVILSSAYQSEEMMKIMRPDMGDKMWIMYVVTLIMSFFFTLIFSKGYEGKGVGEGIRYGLYVGLLMATPMAYSSYAMYPMPYSLALQWFIYGIIHYLILGIIVSLVYGKTSARSAEAVKPAAA